MHVDQYLGQARDAATFLASRGIEDVEIVMQCGSGLSTMARKLLRTPRSVPLDEVPHLPAVSVTGHGQEAVFGRIGETGVLVMTGRIHFYEGHGMAAAGFQAAIAAACGARLFICTNAAGALDESCKRGSVVVHDDFINHMGDSPLFGMEFDDSRQRFVVPQPAYDPLISRRLGDSLQQAGATVHNGVYVAVRGPAFETWAELRMMRAWGGTVVGMSTVPEVIVCHLCRLPVVAVSLVTNECFSGGGASHQEVLAASAEMAPQLAQGIGEFIRGGAC